MKLEDISFLDCCPFAIICPLHEQHEYRSGLSAYL